MIVGLAAAALACAKPPTVSAGSVLRIEGCWEADGRVHLRWRPLASEAPTSVRFSIYEGGGTRGTWREDKVFEEGRHDWFSTTRRSILGMRAPWQWFRGDVLSPDQPYTFRFDFRHRDERVGIWTRSREELQIAAYRPSDDKDGPIHDIWIALAAVALPGAIALAILAAAVRPAVRAARMAYRLLRGEEGLDALLEPVFSDPTWKGFVTCYLFALSTKVTIAARVPAALGLVIPPSDAERLEAFARTLGTVTLADWNRERLCLQAGMKRSPSLLP